jgi:ABC-type transporter Mla MlaB component
MNPEERDAKEVVGLDPWGLKRIEKLLVELEGVGSLKIVPDGHGGIDEIHVLSSSSLGPKQIVRNIESALLAEFGLQVDHRKISIARVRSPEISMAAQADGTPGATHHGQQTAPEPDRASDRRLILKGLHIERSAGQRMTCKVEIEDAGEVLSGEAEGPDFEKGRLEIAAAALLEALQQASEENVHLSLQGISKLDSLGRSFVVAIVGAAEGRKGITLAGIAHITDSPEEAAVLATLHATNRWLSER